MNALIGSFVYFELRFKNCINSNEKYFMNLKRIHLIYNEKSTLHV